MTSAIVALAALGLGGSSVISVDPDPGIGTPPTTPDQPNNDVTLKPLSFEVMSFTQGVDKPGAQLGEIANSTDGSTISIENDDGRLVVLNGLADFLSIGPTAFDTVSAVTEVPFIAVETHPNATNNGRRTQFVVKVYPQPSADVFLISPAAGKTLAGNWQDCPDGKTMVLGPGYHGDATITKALTKGITVKCQDGAVAGRIFCTPASANWTFDGIKQRREHDNPDGPLINNSNSGQADTAAAAANRMWYAARGSRNIHILNSDLACVDDQTDWTDDMRRRRWLLYAIVNASTGGRVEGNKIKWVRNCISLNGNGGTAVGNTMEENTVDFIQIAANNLRVTHNIMKNSRHNLLEYGRIADGGLDLHADFIQGYGAPSNVGRSLSTYSNIIIEDNYCHEGPYSTQGVQGIGSFDGHWINVSIKRNFIRCNSYQGIYCYGFENVQIEDNDLDALPVTANPGGITKPWLLVGCKKVPEGMQPPRGLTSVKRNKTPILWMFSPGVYASIRNAFSLTVPVGYDGTSITFDPPAAGAPAVGKVRYVVTTKTEANGSKTETARRLSGYVEMSDRAADRYPQAPSYKVDSDRSDMIFDVNFCDPGYYKLNGASQIEGNKLPNGNALNPTWVTTAP